MIKKEGKKAQEKAKQSLICKYATVPGKNTKPCPRLSACLCKCALLLDLRTVAFLFTAARFNRASANKTRVKAKRKPNVKKKE